MDPSVARYTDPLDEDGAPQRSSSGKKAGVRDQPWWIYYGLWFIYGLDNVRYGLDMVYINGL